MDATHITLMTLSACIIVIDAILAYVVWQIHRISNNLRTMAQIVARQAEILRKISETRWGIYD